MPETFDANMSTNIGREAADQPEFRIESSNILPIKADESTIPKLESEEFCVTVIDQSSSARKFETSLEKIASKDVVLTRSLKNATLLTFSSFKTNYDTFISLQKWEGTVIELDKNTIVAKLVDLTHNEHDEIAKLPMEDVQKDEQQLVKPGAVFFLNIGYMISKSGTKSRQTLLLFRDLPVWDQKELENATIRAREMRAKLNSSAE